MKKYALRSLAMVLLLMLSVSALAAAPAVPNQKLSFRTGPNTAYAELYTLPQSTAITAIEYEEGNGVTWVLVEFIRNGERVRAYTGLKRMTVQGNIPWADHLYIPVEICADGAVYAAPGRSAAYRGSVECFQDVTLLRYDGDFAFIEFYDTAAGCVSRGWVEDWMVDYEIGSADSYPGSADSGSADSFDSSHSAYIGGSSGGIVFLPSVGADATPNQQLSFRTGPNTKYVELYTLPQSTDISAIEYESGNGVTWVLVEFVYNGQVVRAYTGLKRMTVHGSIPWAEHYNASVRIIQDGTVLAAPSADAAYRGRVVENETVTLLRYDGEFAYIEFYDGSNNAPSRGWVYSWML